MVTYGGVSEIARLSRLRIREDELGAFTKDVDKITNFANTINQATVEPSDLNHINRLENVFHEGVVEPSLPSEEILRNAESQEDGYFLVKKRGQGGRIEWKIMEKPKSCMIPCRGRNSPAGS